MATARIFQIIDLELLPAPLAAQIRRVPARAKRNGSKPLPEMVRLIMLSQPVEYSSMIGLARAWFTRNLEATETIQNAHRAVPDHSALAALHVEVRASCLAARLAAARALKSLNLEYAVSQTTTAGDLQDRFWSLHAAFVIFFREMGEVELHISEAKVRDSALQARIALEAANLKLETKRTALTQLQRQIAKVRREMESSNKPPPVTSKSWNGDGERWMGNGSLSSTKKKCRRTC